MFDNQDERLAQIRQYLLASASKSLPDQAEVVAVFGRYCPLLAQALADVVAAVDPQLIVVSGNVGKDSGILARSGLQIAESHYVVSAADVLKPDLMLLERVHVDLEARNGYENARNMVKIIQALGLNEVNNLVVIAHTTQLRRLSATFARQANGAELKIGQRFYWPSGYSPTLDDPRDVLEMLEEFCRLDSLSRQGVFRRPHLDQALLCFAQAHAPVLRLELEEAGMPDLSTAGLGCI